MTFVPSGTKDSVDPPSKTPPPVKQLNEMVLLSDAIVFPEASGDAIADVVVDHAVPSACRIELNKGVPEEVPSDVAYIVATPALVVAEPKNRLTLGIATPALL